MFFWSVLTAQAGKKQIFITGEQNKVEVEVMDNPTKVYEENGELYLIPGQAYTFKLTGMPTTGYTVVRPNPLTTKAIQVPENPAADKNQTLLEVTFKDAAENKFRVKPEIKIVKPEFTSLTVTGGFDPALHYLRKQKKDRNDPDAIWALGGQTKPHVGVVTFKPGAARVEFDICLEQWVSFKSFAKNAQGQIIVDNQATSYEGLDTPYQKIFNDARQLDPTDPDAYLSVIPLGTNQLKAECEDFPGLPRPRTIWANYYKNNEDVTVTFNANLYLRCAIQKSTNWKTLGMVQWGVDAVYKATGDETVTEGGHGNMDPKTGAPPNIGHSTSEEPKAPKLKQP